MKNQRPATGTGGVTWSILDPSRYRERLAFAIALSLYLHGLILLLQFGASGFGLPGLAWPWAERRVQAPKLTVRLVEVPRPPPASAAEPVRLRGATSVELRAPKVASAVPPPAPPLSLPRREGRAPAPAAKARARDRKIQAKPQPQILAQSDPQAETFKVPPPKPPEPEQQRALESAAKKQTEEPPPAAQAEQAARRHAEEAARLAAEEAARQRAEEDARQRKLALQKELEAKKQEEARRLEDANKQEEARRLALELEARRLAEETARQETEERARERMLALQKEREAKKLDDARRVEETLKQEEARKQEEIKKQEEARRMTLEVEALKRAEEAARQQAAARRKELEARRQAEEAAARGREIAERQRAEGEAAQRERERLAAQKAPAPAPGALAGKELAAKALDQLRAARVSPPLPPARAENPRRRALIGVERDVSLRMYVESWRWKIERNGPLNYRQAASWAAHDSPILTVSIRSDGSLEDVLIHRSSGVRELDEAALRIARLQAPYSAFPAEIARQYDVIEIRRVWFFDKTLKILDEM